MRTRSEQTTPGTADVDTGIDLGSSLGFLVGAVSKRMTGRLNAALAEHGLTTAQWAVLACLWHEDGLTQTELSTRTGIDAATLAEMLKRMVAAGRVSRRRDETNHRYQRVHLVEHDHALRDAIARDALAINAEATAGLSGAETTELSTLLRRVLTNLIPEGDSR